LWVWWSGREVGVVGEFVEGGLVGTCGAAQPGWGGWIRVGDFGQSGAEQVIVGW
jgi:hypothetical protein